MSVPPPHKPNLIVILINVDTKLFGTVHYSSFFLFNGQPAADPIVVKIGDRIGWYVRVISNNLPVTLPYQLTFTDPSVFGVPALQVPAGGGSSYLTVLPNISGLKTKYTLSVSGITPVFDPEIQTDSSGSVESVEGNMNEQLIPPAHYVVSWQPDASPVTLTCTKNNSPQPFPVTAAPGDVFQFQAAADPATTFVALFDPANRFWQSPFDPFQNTFVGEPNGHATSSTGPLTVGDVTDADKEFKFHTALQNDSKRSDSYKIIVKTSVSLD